MKKFLGFVAVVITLLFVSLTAKAESYTAYLTPAQEVPAAASTAFGKARIVLNESTMMISFSVTFNGLGSTQTASHIHGPAAVGGTAGVLINFGAVGGTSGVISGTAAITAGQIAQLRSGQFYVNVHSTNFPNGEIRGQLAKNRPVDFDGDGITDYSVLRFPSVMPPGVAQITYWNLRSTDGSYAANFGDANTDFPTPGDYDGDGKDDLALYRDGATPWADSFFFIFRTTDSTLQSVKWGVMGDQAVCRDYDGDGITDIAVYRRGTLSTDQAVWYIRQSSMGFVQRSVPFGLTGTTSNSDTPVPGDYDGDGKFDIAVYRFGTLTPSNTFIVQRSSDGAVQFQQWGNFTTDYIAPGDFDGDGKTDYVAARTGALSTSPMTWYIRRSSDGTTFVRTFGISSDIPTQGDYDGDGKTDISVYRGSSSVFYVLRSFDGVATGRNWGLSGDFATATFDAR